MTAGLSVIVPTLGRSPHLRACLRALRNDGGSGLEILLVAQGAPLDRATLELADQVVELPTNLGFARANNLAFEQARGDLLATVNDDVVVSAGWHDALFAAFEGQPDVAAVQGTNLKLDDPKRIDGCGLAWNRFWQAIQIGHGEPASTLDDGPVEVFGVSATAAIYRRDALQAVGGAVHAFEPRLISYYEDVDLACRLRAAGYRALWVPEAHARHAGSVTGQEMGWRRTRLIYGNRYLVLTRLLGRSFWPLLPRLVGRDAADLWNALKRGRRATARGIVAGQFRAMKLLPRFVRFGAAAVPLADLQQFQRP